MSWVDDIMIEQAQADALAYMGEAEWRDLYGERRRKEESEEERLHSQKETKVELS